MLHPRDGEAHGLLATVMRQAGRMAEAAIHFDQALALNPRLAGVHYNRVRSATVKPDDPQIAVMQGLVGMGRM